MQSPDGTATCDRCGTWLPGYGVLFGMVLTDFDSAGGVASLIVCYDCRLWVLGPPLEDELPPGLVRMLLFDDGPKSCSRCGAAVTVRSVSNGLLTEDLHPDGDPAHVRHLLFCRAAGCRDAVLARLNP